jgi:hypothetical protein
MSWNVEKEVLPHGDQYRVTYTNGKGLKSYMATVYPSAICPEHGEAEKIAQAISALPDLLSACKALLFHAEHGRRWKTVTHMGLDFTMDEFENRLKAVIDKAEGR